MKTDWEKIKGEYLKGLSREEICDKYKIKYSTLNKRITRDKWNDKRDKIALKVSQKLEEKISDSISDIQAKFVKKQFEFFNEVFDDEIQKYKALKSSSDYSLPTNDLKEAVRMARQAINLFDSKNETTGNLNIVNKYKELTAAELEAELLKRGLPTKIFDK